MGAWTKIRSRWRSEPPVSLSVNLFTKHKNNFTAEENEVKWRKHVCLEIFVLCVCVCVCVSFLPSWQLHSVWLQLRKPYHLFFLFLIALMCFSCWLIMDELPRRSHTHTHTHTHTVSRTLCHPATVTVSLSDRFETWLNIILKAANW